MYPFSLYIGIGVAIIYCLIFWNMGNLGRYRIPLFVYAIVVQSAFLLYFFWTDQSSRTDDGMTQEQAFAFGDRIVLFYFFFAIPLILSLWIQMQKEIWKLEIDKKRKWIMMALFVVVCVIFSIIGFFAHVFFYYGFAP